MNSRRLLYPVLIAFVVASWRPEANSQSGQQKQSPPASPAAPAKKVHSVDAHIAQPQNAGRRARMLAELPARLRNARARGGSDLDLIRRVARELKLELDWLSVRRGLAPAIAPAAG